MNNVSRLLFFVGLISFSCFGQDELDFKPRTTFTDGLGLVTPDTSFSINFRFRMQNRAGMLSRSYDDLSVDKVEARVRRLRLRMDGFIVNPRLSYYIQLSFSRGDQDWDNTGIPNVVRDAALFYFLTPNTYLCFGQTKLPGNRQRVISSGMQQFAERSIANAIFNIDRDFGLRIYHEQLLSNMFFRAQGAISTGEGRNAVFSDSGLAYTGRLEWLPLGKFKKDGDYFEGDLLREERSKISLGSTFSYNQGAMRTGGQIGRFLIDQTDIRTFILDGAFKYQGVSIYGEYFLRTATNYDVRDLENNSTFIYGGESGLIQGGYLFQNNFEVVARYARVIPNEEIRDWSKGFNELTLGINKYLNQHRVKTQLNLSYFNDHQKLSELTGRWGIMFQVEVGI